MRNEDSQTWTTGANEVDIATTALAGGSTPGALDSAEWIVNVYTGDDNTLDLPDGPYRFTLRQMTFDADTEFPLPEHGVD